MHYERITIWLTKEQKAWLINQEKSASEVVRGRISKLMSNDGSRPNA